MKHVELIRVKERVVLLWRLCRHLLFAGKENLTLGKKLNGGHLPWRFAGTRTPGVSVSAALGFGLVIVIHWCQGS